VSAATGADGALLSLVQSLDATFARAIDRGEHDLLREVLVPDVEYVTSGVVLQGVDAVVARFAARRAPRTTRHQAGAPHVVRRTGALLKTTSVWTCWAAHGDATPSLGALTAYSVADFEDTWTLAAGGCRLRRREIRLLFRDPVLAPSD